MTQQDMDRVWALMGYCRLNDPHLNDKPLRAVWQMVLEPYAYEDVKAAIIAYFRRKKFWPDIGEITMFLPPPPPPPYFAPDQWREELDCLPEELKHGITPDMMSDEAIMERIRQRAQNAQPPDT